MGLGINREFQGIVFLPSWGLGKPQWTYRFEAQNPVMVFSEERKERVKIEVWIVQEMKVMAYSLFC